MDVDRRCRNNNFSLVVQCGLKRSTWCRITLPFSNVTTYDTWPQTLDTTPESQTEPWPKLRSSKRSPMLNWRWQACWSWLVFICCYRYCTLPQRSGCKRSNCNINGLPNRSAAGDCRWLLTVVLFGTYLNKKWANLVSIEPSVNVFESLLECPNSLFRQTIGSWCWTMVSNPVLA